MASEPSPSRDLENVNIPGEIDAPLNSPTTSVPSITTISDSEDENNSNDGAIVIDSDEDNEDDKDDEVDEKHFDDGGVIVIDSDSDEGDEGDKNDFNETTDLDKAADGDTIEMKSMLLNKYDRRLKYKMRRAINILLRFNSNLSEKEIAFLKKKKDEMKCKESNEVVENVVNWVSRVKSERLWSEKQNLRGLETLRRRYLEAIRSSYEIFKTWLSDEKNDCVFSNNQYVQWALTYILGDVCLPVVRELNGEIKSNKLDKVIQNIDFSDSEESDFSIDSEKSDFSIDSEESEEECESLNNGSTQSLHESEHSSSDIYFYNDEGSQLPLPKPYYENNKAYKQNIIRQQRLQQRKQRLQRRQRLRNRFKIIHGQFYNGDGKFRASSLSGHFGEEKYCSNIPPSTSMVDQIEPLQPYVHTIIQGADVHDHDGSSHAITNNLLATPVMRVQRRSRSRTRNHGRPRRFCSVSPPSNRAFISQEQMRSRSRSPLSMPKSPTRPLVPTIPIPRLLSSQLPRSPPATTTTTANISASTVTTTEATAGRPRLSSSPPEALGSTLQRGTDDDDATAKLSQVALTLLELSEQ